jgi:hypothetical protein
MTTTARRVSRTEEAVRHVLAAEETGTTCREYEREMNLGHGAASGALSRAHQKGYIARLARKRGRHAVYVSPSWVLGRRTVAHGSTRRPEPVTLTRVQQIVDEWNLLRVERFRRRLDGPPTEIPIRRVSPGEARALAEKIVEHLAPAERESRSPGSAPRRATRGSGTLSDPPATMAPTHNKDERTAP